ncbi:HD-GYP domain-containing protein [Alicyclobacillus suci]|uniref:HD-GYP domain-containing protein n=1 Tax=Alicyclobacillus suci TaxID=2816080 RepID=UPI001A8DFDA0|nr:HD domain-containing phosphohydrolase [Alicyclobacillus suci]
MVTMSDWIRVENVMQFIEADIRKKTLLKFLKAHHPSTYWHSLRVAYLSLMLARSYAMSEDELERLFCSTLLHDIGKVSVPVEVLNKPGKLSEENWAHLHKHPENGAKLMIQVFANDGVDLDVIRLHHENLNGSGYPFGKKGQNLSLAVRIVRVVDSFDSMTHRRAYNRPKSARDAIQELHAMSDTHYDFDVVRRLHRLFMEHSQDIHGLEHQFNILEAG